MSTHKENLIRYLNNARNLLSTVVSPGFERILDNIDNLAPFVDHLEHVFFIIDFREDKYLYLSENSYDVMGVDRDVNLSTGVMRFMETFFHERDFQLLVEKVFNEGLLVTKKIKDYDMSRQRITCSFRVLQQDGSYKMCQMQFAHALEDDDRNPLVIMGTASDIHEIHTQNEMFCRIHYQNAKGKWEKIHERFYPLDESTEDYRLTPKEFELIRFIHNGLSSKEIANLTQRSEETIKSQRKSILAKTGCQSMTDVVVMAMKNKWV